MKKKLTNILATLVLVASAVAVAVIPTWWIALCFFVPAIGSMFTLVSGNTDWLKYY